MKPILSKHAEEQLIVREIDLAWVNQVMLSPLQRTFFDGLGVYDGIIIINSKRCLLRIFINEDKIPPLIVTVYKTSKINKYYEGDI